MSQYTTNAFTPPVVVAIVEEPIEEVVEEMAVPEPMETVSHKDDAEMTIMEDVADDILEEPVEEPVLFGAMVDEAPVGSPAKTMENPVGSTPKIVEPVSSEPTERKQPMGIDIWSFLPVFFILVFIPSSYLSRKKKD